MNLKCIVLFINQWSFTDEKTGQLREGTTCQYILNDNLNPSVNEDGSRGYDVVKVSLPFQEFRNFDHVPGLYSARFTPKTRQGRGFLEPRDFKYLAPLAIGAPEIEKK